MLSAIGSYFILKFIHSQWGERQTSMLDVRWVGFLLKNVFVTSCFLIM